MKFKVTLGVILTAVTVWFGWWFWARAAQEAAILSWFDQRRAAGWQAELDDLTVEGFPNRLDARLTGLTLADPVSGWAWEAPRLDIYQLAYDPGRVIVEWPEDQTVAAPGARAAVRAETMRASAAFADPATLALERSSMEIVQAGVAAETGWTASVDRYQHHIRRAPAGAGPENTYEFRVDAARVRPPAFLRRMADPAEALPAYLETLALEGRAALDRPLDIYAFEGTKPQLTALSLKEAQAKWGELALSVTGSLHADGAGYAAGDLDISARNWRAMLDAAVSAGALDPSLAKALKEGLGLIARLAGDPKELNVTLTYSGGYAKIGPIPVGPAPRLLR